MSAARLTLPAQLLTVGAARDWVERNRRKGVACPCCGRYTREYRRQINAGMARSLIAMSAHGTGWVHVPRQIGARSREEGKLAYWGLVEQSTQPRADGGRAGWWRLTGAGLAFANDQLKLPMYAYVYDDKVQALAGPLVGIRHALRSKFNYDELMAAR